MSISPDPHRPASDKPASDKPASDKPASDKPAGNRELFKSRAYEEIHAKLYSGQYEPGAFLSERQLAAELGMSKTPIKAALERLEMEGYIIVSPQSGIRVRQLTAAEVAELYDVRVALECFVIKSVTGKLSSDQFQRWKGNLDAMAAAADTPIQRPQIIGLDTEFHELPSQFLGNQEIIKLMQQYSQRIRMVTISVFTRLPNRATHSLAEHQEIFEAVRRGNPQAASDLMERHIRFGQALLSQIVEQSPR